MDEIMEIANKCRKNIVSTFRTISPNVREVINPLNDSKILPLDSQSD